MNDNTQASRNGGKQKLTLIIPNTRWFGKKPWISIPYSALILTSLLKDEFEFSIVDANGEDLSEDQLKAHLADSNSSVIMVTGTSVEYHSQVHRTFALAKAACPGCTTILGGVYATTLPEEAIKDRNIDWLFMYHAEDRINEFLNLLLSGNASQAKCYPGIAYRGTSNELIANPPSHYIGDLLEMTRPDYSLVDLNLYLKQNTLDYQFNSDKPSAFIISSYGCPNNCVFCASRTISGRKVAFRPIEHVLDEIEFLMGRHNVGNLVFLDDALLVNRKRAVTMLNSFLERKYNLSWKAAAVAAWHLDEGLLELMKASGCTQITISVESGSQRVLRDVMHKPLNLVTIPGLIRKCHELGIVVGANFVIGVPGETWDEIRQTFRFADQNDFDVSHFKIATPLPRTDLYRIASEKGYLSKGFSFLSPDFFGFGAGFITTEEFTPFELTVLRAFEWDRINFGSPEKLQRVAKLYDMSEDDLNEHRRQTRRKLGIHFSSASK